METEKKEEINTGAGKAPKVKSGKRRQDRQRVRNAPVEGRGQNLCSAGHSVNLRE